MTNLKQLTSIERQLLTALNRGDSNKRIAADTAKSELTVRNQLTVLFKKVGVANRTQAVGWFRDQLAYPSTTEHGANRDTATPSPTSARPAKAEVSNLRRRFSDWHVDQRR